MAETLDIRVMELLCSRLCHDLVSPVGAINNGIELIDETQGEDAGRLSGGEGSMLEEALGLIAHSATQAARRLKLFRFAYGTAGALARDFSEARSAAEGWLSSGRTTLDWAANQPPRALAGRHGAVKMLLNLVVLAEECVPQGGVLHITGAGTPEQGEMRVEVRGPALRLPQETRDILFMDEVDVASLTPRTIHAFVTRRFAAHYAMTLLPLVQDVTGGGVALGVTWTVAL